jgi:hypothetical protein
MQKFHYLWVVDEQIALLGATNERTIHMPGMTTSRSAHSSASDSGLKLILFEIKDILRRDAVKNISGKLNLSYSGKSH